MACTHLDFLNEDSVSICMYKPLEILVQQNSIYCAFMMGISIKDWIGVYNNFPLKNNKCYDKESFREIQKILKGLQCLKI